MAYEIKLEVLTFKIRSRKTRKKDPDYANLADLDGQGTDFINLFKKYLETIEVDLEDHEDLRSALRLKSGSLKFASKSRKYRGIIESGHYGQESILENIKTRSRKKKELDDVDILPFYFLISAPENADTGILMLQRYGIFGVSTVLKKSLAGFIKKTLDMHIEFNPHITKELAKEFLNGGIKEIILTKYNLPSDKADKLGMKSYSKQILSIELRIKARKNVSFGKAAIRAFVSDPNTQFLDTQVIRDVGFEGDRTISVVSDISGTRRKVDLSNSGDIRPYYDIDSDVVKDTSGQPKFDSIDEIALKMLSDFGQKK